LPHPALRSTASLRDDCKTDAWLWQWIPLKANEHLKLDVRLPRTSKIVYKPVTKDLLEQHKDEAPIRDVTDAEELAYALRTSCHCHVGWQAVRQALKEAELKEKSHQAPA